MSKQLGALKGGDAYLDSPKGASQKGKSGGAGAAAASGGGGGGIKRIRRRLSVVSDNKLIEGVEKLLSEDKDEGHAGTGRAMIGDYFCISEKGYAPYNPKKRNQDALIEHFYDNGDVMLAVFDGHGEAGDKVSAVFRKKLAVESQKSSHFSTRPDKAMEVAYEDIEGKLLKDASIDTQFSGTTAVSCIIRGKVLTAANIGDSRLIIGTEQNGKLVPTEVTIDHKPDMKEERARIIKAGGRVFAVEYDDGVDGPARVWLGHCDVPGLAMSRSLGDVVAHTAGVISKPECFEKTLTADDKCVILASDGLWEFMSNKEVIDIVAKNIKLHGKDGNAGVAAAAVKELMKESRKRWMAEEQVVDDTTVILAFLKA